MDEGAGAAHGEMRGVSSSPEPHRHKGRKLAPVVSCPSAAGPVVGGPPQRLVAGFQPHWYDVSGIISGRRRGAMDRETFTATIRAFRNWTPFKPFTVALVNGDRYEVDRPETLAL